MQDKLFQDENNVNFGKIDEKKTEKKSKFTKNGYYFSDVTSALQKAIRRGQEKEAVFWAFEMADSKAEMYLWRRLVTIASEDVGLGSPEVAILVGVLAENWKKAWGERCIMVQAILIMCRAKKNRECDNLAELVSIQREKEEWRLKIPLEAMDMHSHSGGPRIKEIMAEKNQGYRRVTDDLFYKEGAVISNPVEREGNKYTKELLEYLGVPYEGF